MRRAWAWVAAAYAAAMVVAVLVARAVPGSDPLWVAFVADVAATLVVFGFSVLHDNSSFYDPYWSLAPIPIAVYWVASAPAPASKLRAALIVVLICVWGLRLTWNWARGWQGLGHEDWRYVDLRRKTGRFYWPVSLAGIHMLPTLWVFGGLLPVYAALVAGTRGFGVLDLVAAVVTAAAIWIEAEADRQLRAFRMRPHRPDEILATGLWARSRHPNYFGEMSFWWGLYLFGLAAAPSWWWTGVGALAITLMFRFISLPMMEERMLARRPGYAEHQRRTPLVLLTGISTFSK
ncbi:MAG: DUF1295 domain-containing protein [Candidatus Dadabacteria bacterium]|nr:MAG: DUF1295 domain-containing protein [Candidatus Dadabacteria bacterium]